MITEFRSNQLRLLAKRTVGVGAKLERVCSTPNEKTGIAGNQLRQLRELCCIRKNYDLFDVIACSNQLSMKGA